MRAGDRQALPVGKVRKRAFPHSAVEMGTGAVLHEWSQPQPTSSRNRLCGASGANLSRLAWPVGGKRSKFSRWFGARKRWAATILAPVDQAKSTRSATGRKLSLDSYRLWNAIPTGINRQAANLHNIRAVCLRCRRLRPQIGHEESGAPVNRGLESPFNSAVMTVQGH